MSNTWIKITRDSLCQETPTTSLQEAIFVIKKESPWVCYISRLLNIAASFPVVRPIALDVPLSSLFCEMWEIQHFPVDMGAIVSSDYLPTDWAINIFVSGHKNIFHPFTYLSVSIFYGLLLTNEIHLHISVTCGQCHVIRSSNKGVCMDSEMGRLLNSPSITGLASVSLYGGNRALSFFLCRCDLSGTIAFARHNVFHMSLLLHWIFLLGYINISGFDTIHRGITFDKLPDKPYMGWFPYAFSWKEELSTSSKASMYKGSAPTKNSPGSAPSSPGSAPPTKTPGSGNQRVKLVLGSAAVVALITTAFYAEWPGKLPIGENKKEQTPPLPGSEQTDVKGSQVIDDGHLKNESSTHNEQDQVSLNLYKEKEQDTVEGMKQSNGTQEAQSIQEEVEDMQKENTTEEPKDRVEHEANKPGEYMLNASNEEENLKDSELSNDIKGDAVSSDMDGISSKETLSEDHGMKMSVSADVKEVDKSTDSKQEVAAGGTIINGKDSEIRAAHYHDLIASKALQHVCILTLLCAYVCLELSQ
eukprot:Gb_08994 [translate_table: standard]